MSMTHRTNPGRSCGSAPALNRSVDTGPEWVHMYRFTNIDKPRHAQLRPSKRKLGHSHTDGSKGPISGCRQVPNYRCDTYCYSHPGLY